MFKLIRNIDHAYIEAGDFIARLMPNSDIPNNAVSKSFSTSFPSLIDWFVNRNYRDVEVLDSHICDKSIAKCLIYPKTNKLRHSAWRRAQSIEEIPNIVYNSILFDKNTGIIKTDGFDEVAAELKQGEVFLVNARTLFTVKIQHNKAHTSIVNTSLAKSLVYYKKDTEEAQIWSKFVIPEKYEFRIYGEPI
jgi:hypothetical protein